MQGDNRRSKKTSENHIYLLVWCAASKGANHRIGVRSPSSLPQKKKKVHMVQVAARVNNNICIIEEERSVGISEVPADAQ